MNYAAILNAAFEVALLNLLYLVWSFSIALVIATSRLTTSTMSSDGVCRSRMARSGSPSGIVASIVVASVVIGIGRGVVGTVVSSTIRSAICASVHRWPVVLGNAGPENPDCDNG